MIVSSYIRTQRLLRCVGGSVSALAAAALLTGTLHATPVPANLGNGLGKILESNLAVAEAAKSGRPLPRAVSASNGRTYVDAQTAHYATNALTDATGRLLVRVTLNGKTDFKTTRKAMKAAAGSLTITAKDKTYRGVGIMNAYVDEADVAALAQTPGVAAVILELKPQVRKINIDKALAVAGPKAALGEVMTKLGTDFDQGVTQHRVDQINQYYNPSAPVDYEGTGMQIACISNSFNAHTAKPASTDVTNFDLPGSATNPVNTNPVFVLLDDLSSTSSDDEGRGMCQIAYKMAPKAKIAFGTADTGEVGFANVIRALAGVNSSDFPNASTQGFKADTECDDVGYFDEPFFQDGIVGMGVADASANGTCYFSSAANDIGTNGYDSVLRFVPNGTGLTAAAGNTALAGTNINLANVPAALYAGGFHNFNPASGKLDVAQTVNDSSSSTTDTVLQWNEPYDQTAEPTGEQLIYTVNGNYTSTADNAYTYTITPSLTKGTIYELDEVANGDGFDGAITITSPSGAVLVPRQDNAVDEVVRFQADVTGGGYTVTVGHYLTTTGAFTLNLYSTTGYPGNTVQTQISLLVFDSLGNYLPGSSLTQNALVTDEPIQLGLTTATGAATGASTSQVQFVIARANVPTGPNVATEVRYLLPGNGAGGLGPDEYFTYTSVTTGGHAMESSCNGCAAVSVFRPSLPEYFTSPGPVTVYYDKMNNRLPTPDIRLQPRIATADAANVSSNMNTYFASDTTSDPDTNGNFSGTSAAGPHAAAIAALVLQAHGGPKSMTPAQMTSLLERSTFPHDLDPNFSSGAAKVSTGGKVTVTVSSDNSSNTSTGLNDNNAFTINYVGGSSVTSFVFNPGGTGATAGDVSMGNNGVTYAPTSSTTPGGTATYFSNPMPGAAFLVASKGFTVGGKTTVTGAAGTPSSVLATFSNPSSAVASQNYTMSLAIPAGDFNGGNILTFGVGRGNARTAAVGNTGVVVNSVSGGSYYCADIFGGGVTYPDGTTVTNGMTFSGMTADGGTFSGVIKNNIGSGYSPLDGYGFVNAQVAVGQTVQ